MMAAQVDGRNRAHRAERRAASRQTMRRHADTHSALDDRQEGSLTQARRFQAA